MEDDRFRNTYRIPSARAAWHDYSGGTYFVTICTQNREHHFGSIVYNQNNEAEMEYSEMGRYANEQFKNVSAHYPYAEIPLWVVMPNHVHCLVIIRNNDAAQPNVETVCTPSPLTQNDVNLIVETVCTPSLPMQNDTNSNVQTVYTPSLPAQNDANSNVQTVCTPSLPTQNDANSIVQTVCTLSLPAQNDANSIVQTVCTPSLQSQNDANSIVQTVCTPSLLDSTRWKNGIVNETMQNISKKRGLLSTTIGGLKRAITHFARENGIYFQWQTRFHDHIVRDWDDLNRIADYIQHNPARWLQDKFYSVTS